MNLTTSQKRLGLALLFVVAALIVDRLLPSDAPAAANAEDLLVRPVAKPAEAAADPTAPHRPGEDRTAHWGSPGVYARLTALAQLHPPAGVGRDPFHLERPRVSVTPITPPNEDTPRRVSAAEQFAARHHLRAIIGTGRGGMVLVSDRMIRLGEGLDGWRLVHIARDAATFENDGVRVILPLSDPRSEGAGVK